ncbi:hypothetical protein SeMB42_g01580 [Synchytrium endobioticum]|uniref:SPX domain-containing protein n=1 Tax=Synchytrium endobioticum TaxID=286115 RepID=A0A507DDR9_9FUNG|nr:hypothetical protein SeLEV6574_g01465 [Synchytrium endobioticum]TPX52231.1 hypothetical protein SeMB42_g01580 [Synchytrium endobioticum]
MKFAHSIRLNAFAEWSDNYMNYSNLKKLLYRIEKSLMSDVSLPSEAPPAPPATPRASDGDVEIDMDDETTRLLTPVHPLDADALFTMALDKELHRIIAFYREKEAEIYDDVHEFEIDMSYLDSGQYPRRHSLLSGWLQQNNTMRGAHVENPRTNSDAEEVAAGASSRSHESSSALSDPSHSVSALPPINTNYPCISNGDALTSSPYSVSGSVRASPRAGRQHRLRAKSESHTEWTEPIPRGPASAPESAPVSENGRADTRLPVSRANSNRLVADGSHSTTTEFATSIWDAKSYKGHRQRFRRRVISLYVSLRELEKYVELNHTGFQKILKKYDKVTGRKLSNSYTVNKLEKAYPFLQSTMQRLSHEIDRVIFHYARICSRNKPAEAKRELDLNLREHLVWERNTVWRDLVALERTRGNVAVRAINPKVDVKSYLWTVRLFGKTVLEAHLPPNFIVALLKILLCLIIFPLVVFAPTSLPAAAQNCLAILCFASALWATEALPLFVTALCVPFLVVVLKVLREPLANGQYRRLDPKEASARIFSDMLSPVIMLLLGGFALASALSKHHIAQWLAQIVLSKAGSSPHSVILANMLVSTLFSMFISNVAAPVLCFSLVTPILRNLPSKSPYAKSLVLGVALAANVGGMASPISSPQNIIAINNMNPPPSWLEWLTVSLPLCIILDVGIWLLLLIAYQPGRHAGEHAIAPPTLYNARDQSQHMKWTGTQIYVVFVLVATIILWCSVRMIEPYVGDMGILSIVPLVAFFGTQILSKDDFNSFLWNVVILAMGGIALGKAVDSSGLLAELTKQLLPHLKGMSVFGVVATVGAVVLVITSFVNHTVGALIILPVVAELGSALPDPAPRTLVMCTALACSAAMGLHVSSFPNMNAISVEDPTGETWLSVSDFLSRGIPASIVAYVGILTVGFSLMKAIHLDDAV